MKSYNIDKILLWIVVFLTFIGFYDVLLLGLNIGLSGFTRQLSIPIRLVIGMCCLLLFIRNYNNRVPYLIWFIIFLFAYLGRIILDYNKSEYFYLPYIDLIFYFISFSIVPFLGLSKVNYKMINFDKLYISFLISAFIFCTSSIVLYGKFIGQVARLKSSSAGEDVISPLILSYCGALIIGVCTTYLINNRGLSKLVKVISFSVVFMAFVPFFLGASRGSIFALFFPFMVITIANLSFQNLIKHIALFAFIALLIFYLDDYLDSGLLDRFLGTSKAIETGSSSASRIDIWRKSYSQFIYNPIFGDKLNTQDVNHYPHNIYLEVLQSVGIFGAIPFFVLLIKGFKSAFHIFKNYKKYSWVGVIFLQSIMQNMFSGALYTAVWFWTSMALILSLSYYLKKNEIKTI